MSAKIFKMAGGVFNAVGSVSPEAGARLAFTLFSRTRSPKPSTKKENALLESTKPRMAESQRQALKAGTGEAVLHRFAPLAEPNEKRLLFTHGWGSRIAYAQGLITGLRQAGFEVYALDLPGHGEAPGRRLHPAMAIETISNAVRLHGPFDAMIGHSFGGYMTVLAAHGALSGKPILPEKLVVIAAPADVRVVLGGYSRMIGLNNRVRNALFGQIERVTGKPAEAAFGPKFIAESGVPTLILHAEDDKEVNADAARAYAEAGANVKLQWLNGLGHRRIVNSPEAVDAITNFIV